MNISTKLKLLQEGYSIDDIESDGIFSINESGIDYDDFSILYESIDSDIEYMSQISMEMLSESSDNKNVIKRFIDWVIQKIRQLKAFFMNLFNKRKKEIVTINLNELKEKIEKKGFKPFTLNNSFEKVLSSPDEAINSLKKVIDNFEEICIEFMDNAHKGFNDVITQDTDVNRLQVIIWNKILGSSHNIDEKDPTINAIDYLLGKRDSIKVISKEQVENIITFSYSFYELWKDVNDALSYYEKQLNQLGQFTDEGFKIIKLICETLLKAFPDILMYIDNHIRRLSVIGKHY
jgi:hypothetical protein